MARTRAGFTFIELLVVVVIIGILASIAIPKFGALNDKARLAGVKSDVRNAEAAEETYFSDYGSYGSFADLQAASNFTTSSGTTMTVDRSATGYTIQATNGAISTGPTGCGVQVGGGAAPDVDGKILCP